MKALIIDRVSPLVKPGLEQQGFLVDVEILPSKEKLLMLLPKYDLLIMRVDPKVDKEILSVAAGHIKMIGICAAGTNHIDLDYAKQVGIKVQNAPGRNSNAVAELTISKMLDLSRMAMEANDEVQSSGIWNKYKYTGHEIKDHVLGIVGFGNIGKAVVKLAQAFGMTTLAYDPYISDEEFLTYKTERVAELNDLCRRSDYISIHTPMTPETKGMIAKEQFSVMKEGAIVINCARGGLIDEDAAKQALQAGKLGGIGVDVLAAELEGKGLGNNATLRSTLFGQKRFIVSPHIGGSTHEGYDAIGSFIISKVAEFYGLNK